jgi:hypothetical protein
MACQSAILGSSEQVFGISDRRVFDLGNLEVFCTICFGGNEMRKLVALLAVLSLVGVASAGITVNVSDGVDVGSGLMSYTVNLDAGYQLYGVDVKFEGPMNQLTSFAEGTTPTMTAASLLQYLGKNIAQDTHFLFVDGDIMPVAEPGGVSYAPAESAGILSAVFVPTGGSTILTSWDLAQIVLPAGMDAVMTLSVSDKLGNMESTVAIIPEPATLGLLAMGVVGLLRKRA